MGNLLLQEEREKGTEQRAKKFTSLQQVRQAFRATG
jgi:hypothetical protein